MLSICQLAQLCSACKKCNRTLFGAIYTLVGDGCAARDQAEMAKNMSRCIFGFVLDTYTFGRIGARSSA